LPYAADLVHYSQHQIKEALISIRINVGLSKKIGQPDYGSLGASCHVEFDLDCGFDNGSTERFEEATRRAYAACSRTIDAQLVINGATQNEQRAGLQHVAEPVNRIVNRVEQSAKPGRSATAAQVRAIHAIANRNKADLTGLLKQFNAHSPDRLSIGHASRLIDLLKNGREGGADEREKSA